MTYRARFISWVACAVLLTGAEAFSGATPPGPQTVYFDVIERGIDSAFEDKGPVLYLLPDGERLGAFYSSLHMNKVPPKEPPRVDFNSNVVLYVSFGRKQTGGYSVKLLDARIVRRALVVKAQLMKPLPNSYLIQMITNPYVLVAVPRAGDSCFEYDRVELRDDTGDLRFTLTMRPG